MLSQNNPLCIPPETDGIVFRAVLPGRPPLSGPTDLRSFGRLRRTNAFLRCNNDVDGFRYMSPESDSINLHIIAYNVHYALATLVRRKTEISFLLNCICYAVYKPISDLFYLYELVMTYCGRLPCSLNGSLN